MHNIIPILHPWLIATAMAFRLPPSFNIPGPVTWRQPLPPQQANAYIAQPAQYNPAVGKDIMGGTMGNRENYLGSKERKKHDKFRHNQGYKMPDRPQKRSNNDADVNNLEQREAKGKIETRAAPAAAPTAAAPEEEDRPFSSDNDFDFDFDGYNLEDLQGLEWNGVEWVYNAPDVVPAVRPSVSASASASASAVPVPASASASPIRPNALPLPTQPPAATPTFVTGAAGLAGLIFSEIAAARSEIAAYQATATPTTFATLVQTVAAAAKTEEAVNAHTLVAHEHEHEQDYGYDYPSSGSGSGSGSDSD
ncbi:hypothetical protein B0T17DRAFT_544871 [Bombardia bombarda]|uniref:Uncharacterized protein n=1 Tax=Bombardia bombarda TaxID=252184 RepID=A0AA39W435_9PEZI|nr:hypothetical protein B0T17DRAFT_544871 [Bombardia bombarda]